MSQPIINIVIPDTSEAEPQMAKFNQEETPLKRKRQEHDYLEVPNKKVRYK